MQQLIFENKLLFLTGLRYETQYMYAFIFENNLRTHG